MNKNLFLLLFCGILFLFHLDTVAQSNPALFTTSISSANQIVEGKIIQQESFWNSDKTMILTRHTLEVYKVFKGNATPTISFTTMGGTIDKQIIKVNGHHFPINYGNTGLFLFTSSSSTAYQLSTDGFIYYDILNRTASSKNNYFQDIATQLYSKLATPKIIKNKDFFFPSSSNQRTDDVVSILPTTITAGTQSILTINGSGFGNQITEQSNVYFSYAPNGGQTDYPVLQFGFVGFLGLTEIVEWTDTRIQVRVPSVAGTGKVRVTNSNGQSFVSSQTLTIPYAVAASDLFWFDFGNQNTFDQEATKNYLSNYNGEGGYTLFVDPAFFANTQQMNALTSALNKWRCATGFNVKISANQAPIPYGSSGKTSISTFNGGEFGDLTTRSYTYSRIEICNTGTELVPFVVEFQIFINSAINWNYSGTTSTNQVDFESEVLKALATGHQLGNVNNTNDLMYYFLQAGQQKRTLSTTNLEAANLMMNYTVNSNNDCGLPSMQKVSSADCTNSVNLPLARFEANITESCQAPLTIRLDNTSRNAISYQWTFQGGNPATSTEKNPTVTYSTAGNYSITLKATNSAGSHTETKTNYIKINNGIDYAVNLGADKVVCQGETVTLDAAIDNATYYWNTGQTTRSIAVQSAGTYSVQVKRNGCTVSDEIRISYNSAATVEAGQNQAICKGQQVQLKATATGATSYRWTPSTGLSNPTILNPIATPSQTTLYTLEVSTGSNCGTVKDSVLITIKKALELPAFPAENQIYICQNDEFVLDATPLNAFNPTFKWSNGSDGPYLYITQSGTYWVEVSDPNFCTFRDTVQVIATPILTVKAKVEEDQSNVICLGDSIRLRATGAAYYEWRGENILSSNAVSNPLVAPTQTTTYSVMGYGGFNGQCEPKSDTITIFVQEKPTLELGKDTLVCQATSYTIDATVRNSTAIYEWENGGNLATKTVTENGIYKVKVITNCGVLEDSIKISFFEPSTLADFDFVVENAQVTFANKSESEYEIEYEWNFGDSLNSTNAEKNPVFVYSKGGTYTVTLTLKAKNCDSKVSIQKEVTIEDFVTGIDEEIRMKKVSLFPNPSIAGTSTLKWQSDLGKATSLVIYNTLGQQVTHQKLSSTDNQNAQLNINLPTLPKGIYILMLSFENYTVQKKWIIE